MFLIWLLRSLAAHLAVAVYALLLAPPTMALAVWLSRPDLLFTVGRGGVRLGLALSGIRFTVRGREKVAPGRTYVFVSNHSSNLDPPVLVLAIPRDVRIIAKKELHNIPLLGRVLEIADFVFVDRKKRDDGQAGVDRAAESVRRGFSFLIFPEGTRSRTGELRGFKKGAFVLAIKAGVELVPVTVHGAHRAMRPGSGIIRAGRLEVVFHDPIPTAGLAYEDRESLLRQAYGVMHRALSG